MEQYGVYAALTSTGSSQAIFNHLQRNPSDEVMTESPRVLWRLNTLRGLSHDEVKQVFT